MALTTNKRRRDKLDRQRSQWPSPELLREILRCEPAEGKLFWRERPLEMFGTERAWKSWNTRFAGTEACASNDGNGYRRGHVFGVMHPAHRVIFAMAHGEWPEDQIDHINGDRSDNRIENLRAVSHAENQRNRQRPSTNTSGVVGVTLVERDRWQAQITHEGRLIFLGYFSDFSEACSARTAADEKYGYHKNHGRAALPTETSENQGMST